MVDVCDAATWTLFIFILIRDRLSPPETHVDNCLSRWDCESFNSTLLG